MPQDEIEKNGREGESLPLVSILIPCYNTERWVRQSIQSALDQDYPNKEVIVVDDGSSDGSVEAIRSFRDAITFEQLPHRGGNAARNALTSSARGEWLQYLDADDFLMPGKISSQMEAAFSWAASADVIYSPVIIQDARKPGSDYILEIPDEDPTVTFIRWGALNTNGLLLRKRAVTGVGGWREAQPCCQEHELLLRLIQAKCRFAHHKHAAAVYRTHGQNTVSRRNPLQVIQVRMELTDRLIDSLRAEGCLTRTHREALYTARMESARSAWGLDPDFAWRLAAKAKAEHSYWVRSSPALPFSYQLVNRVAGFRIAELLAARMRRATP